MRYKDLVEIGWGYWEYDGHIWLATDVDDELINVDTGEVENIDFDDDDIR